jgi:hypothetical protein
VSITVTITEAPAQTPPELQRTEPARGRNSDVFRAGTMIFSLLGLLVAFASLIVAGQAWSRSNKARSDVTKLASGGLLSNKVTVTLQEFTMTPRPDQVKAGTVRITVHNAGSVTHEMVLVHASSIAALPRVAVATADRAVGDIDEEVIPAADKMGETGDVKPGQTVVKTFTLAQGTYVMFCNIDQKNADGSVLNHFQHGMSATFSAT